MINTIHSGMMKKIIYIAYICIIYDLLAELGMCYNAT